MASPSHDPTIEQLKHAQEVLVTIQRLSVRAFNAENLQNLIFIILNDTYQVVPYDRCLLFRLNGEKVELLGASGQSNFNSQTELSAQLKQTVLQLKSRSTQQLLDLPSHSSVYWVPFKAKEEELGLWLEKFDDPSKGQNFETLAPLFKELLAPAYSAAWEKMGRRMTFKRYLNSKILSILTLLVLISLFAIPVHLRVVAPAEVIAVNSFVVTAPIDGIIEKVDVKPGEEVERGQILYEYDKRISHYKYQALQKQVEVLQAELTQAYVLSVANEQTATSQLALLEEKLNKSKVDLNFATKELALLTEKSPLDGLVAIDSPDEWRGKPVKVGEKIMTISNRGQTKLKIWIPERDNIVFAKDIPIRVFLNTMPGHTFEAKILYISPEVRTFDGELPSFEAEAELIDLKEHPKLGLKGSAVIYGERVSLAYYLLRKPIGTLRKFIGV